MTTKRKRRKKPIVGFQTHSDRLKVALRVTLYPTQSSMRAGHAGMRSQINRTVESSTVKLAATKGRKRLALTHWIGPVRFRGTDGWMAVSVFLSRVGMNATSVEHELSHAAGHVARWLREQKALRARGTRSKIEREIWWEEYRVTMFSALLEVYRAWEKHGYDVDKMPKCYREMSVIPYDV